MVSSVIGSGSEASPLLKPDSEHRIRSYVRRQGRITRGQKRALDAYWPRFGVDFSAVPIDLDALFGRQAPRILEIGFGMGEALLETARLHPENDYLGIEVHQPGVGHVLSRAQALGLSNIRVSQTDAIDVLTSQIGLAILDKVCLFFPDPWHKKRHHKRRIIQPEFVRLVCDRLKDGGVFHVATDWEEYAYYILETLENTEEIVNIGVRGFIPRPKDRSLTKFEQRGRDLGHEVFDIKFQKVGVCDNE